ncbi:MAG: hypothetical protein QCH96_04385 [Candidatus Thermoplasmatota archaeon]|nr:hypothetical protein [Candidatus Thermoplasmatota archaeon]
MFQTIDTVIIPYISGLWTLPWILVGFIATIIIAKFTGREKIDTIMKKIGLILLYFFVPVLIFRIFLNTPFGHNEIQFAITVSGIILFMYLLAFGYAKYQVKKQKLKSEKKDLFIKTMLTNQGRSSAFIGSMMLAIDAWRVYAAIFMALVGIALFAIIPYILSYLHKKDTKQSGKNIKALPWFLKLYPWYLLIFVLAGIVVQLFTGQKSVDLIGYDIDVLLKFYTAITIPAALYYVGAGIHPTDLKISELKKLLGLDKEKDTSDHWKWVRSIFFLTVIITPVLISLFFLGFYSLGFISSAWLAVIIINAFLPITSTNMFLLPYGIDKKSTAHVVTWTTLVCVPIVVALIAFFDLIF